MHLFTDIQIITDLHERNVPIFAKGVTSLVSADPDPRLPSLATGVYTADLIGTGGVVHCDFRRWRLCALVTLFCRGYAHWSPPAVRKPPPKRRPQCARPDRRFRAVRKPPSEQASQCARPHRLLRTSRSAVGPERLALSPRTHAKYRRAKGIPPWFEIADDRARPPQRHVYTGAHGYYDI